MISVMFLFVSQLSFAQKNKIESKQKVTFIELGSVKCILYQKMEVVLGSIRIKYPKDVKVIFYDVWTDVGNFYATKYGVKSIPTQIFLDKKGNEYFHHIGFLDETELIKILKQKNVKEKNTISYF